VSPMATPLSSMSPSPPSAATAAAAAALRSAAERFA
jgi:hypothetical protein